MRRSVVAAALASVLAGCQLLLGPNIECGTVPRQECEAMARELVDEARVLYPDLRVTRVTLTTRNGGYSVEFDDGSGYSVTP